jgi:hypothetical protein
VFASLSVAVVYRQKNQLAHGRQTTRTARISPDADQQPSSSTLQEHGRGRKRRRQSVSPVPTPLPRRRRRRSQERVPRLPTIAKIEGILDLLHSYNWSFKELIHTWVGYSNSAEDLEIERHRYNTMAQRRAVLQDAVDELVVHKIYDSPVLGTRCIAAIGGELDRLIDESLYFGRLEPGSITPDYLETFDYTRGVSDVKSKAPTWFGLLETLLEPRRGYTENTIERTRHRSFYMTVMACNARAYNTSSHLLTVMDMYLRSLGVKRRVVETLASFGICHAYTQGNTVMSEVADRCRVCAYPLCLSLTTFSSSCSLHNLGASWGALGQ